MIFAKRTDWPKESNALIEAYQDLRHQNISLINLTESNPTSCGFEFYQDQLLAPLLSEKSLRYDADSQGIEACRKAVAQYYERQGYSVDPDHIFLTASTSEGYTNLFRLLVNPYEKIAFPSPSYPLFEVLTELNDVELSHYPLVYESGQWVLNRDALQKTVDDATKAIACVNPNNPTGSYFSKDELSFITSFCRERNMALVCDEVFRDYCLQNDTFISSAVGLKDCLTFTLSGISKILGLPQMKLSWVVISGPDSMVVEAGRRLGIISDTFLSVAGPIQHAFCEWLASIDHIQSEISQRCRENYQWLTQAAAGKRSVEVLKAQGGWYAVIRLGEHMDEEAFALQLLNDKHVFIHPGYFFDFPDGPHVVLSLLPETGVFQEGVALLLETAAGWHE